MNFVNGTVLPFAQLCNGNETGYAKFMAKGTTAPKSKKEVRAEPPDLFYDRSKEGVAYRLRLVRKVLGGNQREFAAKAGIAAPTYNQYETATNIPSLEEAHRLCDTYKLSLDWIFRGNASTLRRDVENALEALHQARTNFE